MVFLWLPTRCARKNWYQLLIPAEELARDSFERVRRAIRVEKLFLGYSAWVIRSPARATFRVTPRAGLEGARNLLMPRHI